MRPLSLTRGGMLALAALKAADADDLTCGGAAIDAEAALTVRAFAGGRLGMIFTGFMLTMLVWLVWWRCGSSSKVQHRNAETQTNMAKEFLENSIIRVTPHGKKAHLYDDCIALRNSKELKNYPMCTFCSQRTPSRSG